MTLNANPIHVYLLILSVHCLLNFINFQLIGDIWVLMIPTNAKYIYLVGFVCSLVMNLDIGELVFYVGTNITRRRLVIIALLI